MLEEAVFCEVTQEGSQLLLPGPMSMHTAAVAARSSYNEKQTDSLQVLG